MTYGYFLTGVSGSVAIRHVLEGYKSRKGVERAAALYKERFKVAETGRVIFTFNGSDRKYFKGSYSVIERFNAKAFFEFWD